MRIGIEGHARLRESFGERCDRLDLIFAAQHAALELEIGETIKVVRGFGEAHDRLRRERRFVAQAKPIVLRACPVGIGQIGLAAVADIEQIAQRLDRMALNAFAQQGRDRKL